MRYYKPFPQCSALDAEATSVGVGWLDAGVPDGETCEMKKRTPCQSTQVRGRAILVSTATLYAQTPENIWMHCSGEMFINGEFIKMYEDIGTSMNTESIVSGDPTIRINAYADILECVADIIPTAIIITPE